MADDPAPLMDAEPQRDLSRALIFPSGLEGWHHQILDSLQTCCETAKQLDSSFSELLSPELSWIESLTLPETQLRNSLSANQMRDTLVKERQVSRYYLVDAILAELRQGFTLNSELFAQLKCVTVLASIALIHIDYQAGVTQDSTIEEALRNVRLMANSQRDVLTKALSDVDFTAPILLLLRTIVELREQFVKNKSTHINIGTLQALLNRIYSARAKDKNSHQSGRKESLNQTLELTVPVSLDEQTQVFLVKNIQLKNKRYKRAEWEIEEARSLQPASQTMVVSSRHAGLMDINARFLHSRTVGLAMSMRHQFLPANPWCVQHEQITRVVDALMYKLHPEHRSAAQFIVLQLMLGMGSNLIRFLPIQSASEITLPSVGKRFTDVNRNRSVVWVVDNQVFLQRYIEVAHNIVHRKLRKFLPKVDLFLILPLPGWVHQLLDGEGWTPIRDAELQEVLQRANDKAGTSVTLRQVQQYLHFWLVREQVDSAVVGLLLGKAARQCSPLAYSHISRRHVLEVWTRYLGALGLPTSPLPAYLHEGSVGSRLYPHKAELTRLLSLYQSVTAKQLKQPRRSSLDWRIFHNLLVRHCLLVLHLSTAARPVDEMYGRRHDYCLVTRLMYLVDKEGRSVSSARIVPLGRLAVSQLQAWERYLEMLTLQRAPALQHMVSAARAALDGSGSLFFWSTDDVDEQSAFNVERVTPGNMLVQFDALFPLPPNWHRHAVRSYLLEQHVPRYLIDALLGHEEMGAEFSHICSCAPLNELFELVDVLDRWHGDIGLEATPTWKIR